MLNKILGRSAGAFVLVSAAFAMGADYSGRFGAQGIAVDFVPDGAAYGGVIHKDGAADVRLSAHEDGGRLVGAFTWNGAPATFTATLQGDDLLVQSGADSFTLHRMQTPAQPPAAAAGAGVNAAPPPATAPSAGQPSQALVPGVPVAQSNDALAKYTLVNINDVGRAVSREYPDVANARDALSATLPDLARYFGVRPTVRGAYEDARDGSSAFASFSAVVGGKAVNGYVAAKKHGAGTAIFAVFGHASATADEWCQLTGRPVLSDEDRIKAAMAQVPLQVFPFADGTGSVGIAPGWNTQAQTENNLLILGPANQKVRMAIGGTVATPDSPIVRQGQQFGAPMNMLVAPYNDDPATTLANIINATSTMAQRRGGPTVKPEHVLHVTPVKAQRPGGIGAQIKYDVTLTDQTGPHPYRVLIQFEYGRPNNGVWTYYIFLQLIAPPETFARDLPTMMAMAFSLNENAAAVAAKSRREIDAANAHAEAQRAANQKIADANYQRTRDAEADSTKRLRIADDFDETIRGVRTVEDTRTGEQTSVNLADVHQTVDEMNRLDPGRYVELKLRDTSHPLPGHENDADYLPRY